MSGLSASSITPVRRVPQRTCVACRTTGGKKGLLRVVRLPETPDGEQRPVLDITGKRSGRGAYVCASAECVDIALKQKKFERSLRMSVTKESKEWGEELGRALREAILE